MSCRYNTQRLAATYRVQTSPALSPWAEVLLPTRAPTWYWEWLVGAYEDEIADWAVYVTTPVTAPLPLQRLLA